MRRSLTTVFFLLFILVAFPSTGALAQTFEWNSGRVLEVVRRATERREASLADSALHSYKAQAIGYLTFLAQISENFREPPKVIKTDQIASDLYWRAPDLSRQLIKGRRDTLLLPTDINYHRDHLGIVQNNFPDIIRLGDGDEVSDVPHPLSQVGMREYDYAIKDSLIISYSGESLHVYEISVKPKNINAPRAVGAVYVERSTADVVRMTLSFTRSALKQKSLEDVTVVLENGLIDGRFWLPRRQSIEIRRSTTWMDYPVRGIIRGRWEITGYEINAAFNIPFIGPEIIAAPGSKVDSRGMVSHPDFTFEGDLMKEMPPDAVAATDADVQNAQDIARGLIENHAREKIRSAALSGKSVSDFVHVNRVEGFAIHAGMLQRLGAGFAVGARVGYGISDKHLKGSGKLEYRASNGAGVTLSAFNTLRDASLVPERSGVINSFAAQEFGSDYTDLYRIRGAALELQSSLHSGLNTSFSASVLRYDSAGLHAKPVWGKYESVLPVLSYEEMQAEFKVGVPRRKIFGNIDLELNSGVMGIRGKERGALSYDKFLRAEADISAQRTFGDFRLLSRTIAAGVFGESAKLPLQHQVYLGGPITAPGYDFHSLSGNAGLSQRIEGQFAIPFVRVPLAAFGKAPGKLTLAPYVNSAWINGDGWRSSVGIGVLSIFDVLRFDVARGLRNGRWSFGFDVTQELWGIL